LKRAEACFDCKLIYTLGTSTRSLGEFTNLLRRHGIGTVVDVRKFPNSRFEWFCEERLADLLNEAGIDYINMGRQLGGYRKGGYEAFTTTAEFQEALRDLEKVARKKTVAIVCAERLPWRCHRRFIGFELERWGWQVVHILEEKRYWQPRKALQAK
jgi:uncharacterized protein (DUF488 family)